MEKEMIKVGKSLNELSEVIRADNLEDSQRLSIIKCVSNIEQVMNQINAAEANQEQQPKDLNLQKILNEFSANLKEQSKELQSKDYRYDQADHMQKIYFEQNLYQLMLEKVLFKLTQEKQLQSFFYHCKALQFKMFQKLDEPEMVHLLN